MPIGAAVGGAGGGLGRLAKAGLAGITRLISTPFWTFRLGGGVRSPGVVGPFFTVRIGLGERLPGILCFIPPFCSLGTPPGKSSPIPPPLGLLKGEGPPGLSEPLEFTGPLDCLLPMRGALRSFVTVFFNFVPFWISPKRALLLTPDDLAPVPDLEGGGPGGGGGGGGGGGILWTVKPY